jgi:hypothetical protein
VDQLDAPDDSAQFDDELNVLNWRSERLRSLGYELGEAARLATSSVDLHELERLIAKGCPPETAIRIAA